MKRNARPLTRRMIDGGKRHRKREGISLVVERSLECYARPRRETCRDGSESAFSDLSVDWRRERAPSRPTLTRENIFRTSHYVDSRATGQRRRALFHYGGNVNIIVAR